MATLLSGCNTKILEISCEEFKLTITGNPFDKKTSRVQQNMELLSEISVSGEYESIVEIKTYGKVESDDGEKYELVKNDGYSMLPCFYENGQYQIVLEQENESYTLYHMESNLSDTMQSFGNFKVGLIKFESDIGYSSFKVYKGNRCILTFIIEVFPSKIDYKEDYKNIIAEINEEISALAFETIGKTYLSSRLVDTNNQTNTEYINILNIIFEELKKDILRITKNFKHNIETIETVKPIERSRKVSRNTVDYIRKHPSTLLKSNSGFIECNGERYIPTKVVDKKKITTTDIYENRYAKYLIITIIKRLYIIERNINRIYKKDTSYSEFIREKRILLERLLKIYFKDISDLTERKSISLVFQMSPGYRELFKKSIMLKKGLALGEDLYKITPKKIYTLYEIWCYIKIHNIIKDLGYKVNHHGILNYSNNGLYLSLLQNEQAKTIYEKDGEELVLWYNKTFTKEPTTEQRPDTVLCIKKNNALDDRIYIFDAKYRVCVNGKEIGPMEEDINVMHRYRDAIVSKQENIKDFDFSRVGAYVMFPLKVDADEFRLNHLYRSIEAVNIGAIPMLPGNTLLMKERIEKIIYDTFIKVKEIDDRKIKVM